eukprot:6203281-Pleurochrysis_carterae.AAC.3
MHARRALATVARTYTDTLSLTYLQTRGAVTPFNATAADHANARLCTRRQTLTQIPPEIWAHARMLSIPTRAHVHAYWRRSEGLRTKARRAVQQYIDAHTAEKTAPYKKQIPLRCQTSAKLTKQLHEVEEALHTHSQLATESSQRHVELKLKRDEVSGVRNELVKLHKLAEMYDKKVEKTTAQREKLEGERDDERARVSKLEGDLESARTEREAERKSLEDTMRERDVLNKQFVKARAAATCALTSTRGCTLGRRRRARNSRVRVRPRETRACAYALARACERIRRIARTRASDE